MTITQTHMEIGTWSLRLQPQIPGHILDGIGEHALLMVTAGHVPADAAATIDEPLYRGVILTRDETTLSGADLAWYMGSLYEGSDPGDFTQTSGFGPWITALWTAKGPVAVMTDICAPNGLSFRLGPGVSGNMNGGINGTPRTALDRVVCAQLGCEWRMRTSNTIELFTRPNALADQVAVITQDPGGTEPGVVSWRITDMDPHISDEDRRNRMIVRWDNAGSQSTSTTPTHPGWRTYGGAPLEVAEFHSSTATVAANVVAERDFMHAVNLARAKTLSVTVGDHGAVSMLADPGGLLGSAVGVYLPELGMYDKTVSPVQFRGAPIWPASVRVAEVTWPVTRGMGVYLDARWAQNGSGELVDVTDWVVWEADPADAESSSTTFELGLLPRWWDGKRRRV